MTKKIITFYGAQWCADCRVSKRYLDEHGIEYEYIDLEQVPEAATEVERLNNGLQSIPTIVFPDGSVLVEPNNEELAKKVARNT
jgi:glutaredoxin